MGALSKFFSPFYKSVSNFFTILPEIFRFLILILVVLCISYRRLVAKYRYRAMINGKCTKFVYRRNKETMESCSICLSEFQERDVCRELECKHVFHNNCLEKWLHRSRATCPLCRKSVLPEEIVSEHNKLQSDRQIFSSNIEEELALILFSTMNRWTSFHGIF